MTTSTQRASAAPSSELTSDGVYRKVAWRLLPLLFICYIASYLDRVNVGFAKLQMQSELGLSDAAFSLGASIFFLGYFVFEVPSNLVLHKIGAGKWIARIMISWGIVSAATMFVHTATSFYVVRFLLGLAEAGFFPGIILYLTYWFPTERRGRATSLFLTAVAIAGVVGNPVSGWIMHSMNGVNGWQAWQWLFLLEAIPSVILGVVAWFYLEDRVERATWLTQAERELIAREIYAEESQKFHAPIGRVLRDPKVWLCALVYFGIVSGLYGVSFWLPSIIKGMGVADPLTVGLLGAVPWAFSVVAMYLVARSADRHNESRWHTALSSLVGALGLVISVISHGNVVVSMAGLTLCAMGIMSALPVSWSLPTALIGGTAAAAGIAMINALGNLAGFVAPFAIGLIKDATHSTDNGLYLIAALMVLGAIVELSLKAPALQRQRR